MCIAAQFEAGVRKIRKTIFNDDEDAGVFPGDKLMQLYFWALFLLMLNHMARVSLFSEEFVSQSPQNSSPLHPHY